MNNNHLLKEPSMVAPDSHVSPVVMIISICLGACIVFCATPAKAAPPDTTNQSEKMPVSIAVTPSQLFDANFHGGGKVGVSRYLFDVNADKALSETLGAGLHFAYEFSDFHFSAPAAFSGVKPWGEVHRLEFGGSVAYDLTPEWSIYVAPSIQYSREDGAGWGNALVYGGDVTVTRDISPTLTLGLGVEAFDELEQVTLLPLIVINWKITDRLLLANSSHSGPTGQTGLELSYSLGKDWEVATGAAYLSTRFRLNDSGLFRGGIAETSSFPAWGRLSCKTGRHFNFDFYAGAMLGGEMRIDDRNGNKITSDSYDPAAFLALALSARF